jgi:hypothetical protein
MDSRNRNTNIINRRTGNVDASLLQDRVDAALARIHHLKEVANDQ